MSYQNHIKLPTTYFYGLPRKRCFCNEISYFPDYVYPIRYWIENIEEKDNYITWQKQKMKQIDCRYFRKGKGKCPFGNTCMFLHALPNGQIFDVGPPKPRRRSPGTSGNTF